MKNLSERIGLFRFGIVIPGLTINGKPAPYSVLNERAVRAGAGIMFALGIVAFTNAFFVKNFLPLKIVVAFFFLDFFLKVIIGTKFSPIHRLGQLIVAEQKPEYVGAVQKRFAWSLGLLMSSVMIVLLYVLQVQGPISLTLCTVCLTFMWLETSFGICVGCKIYYGLIRMGIIDEPEHRPACPGGACPVNQYRIANKQ